MKNIWICNICYKQVNIFDRFEEIRVLKYNHKADAQMLKQRKRNREKENLSWKTQIQENGWEKPH